MFQLNDVREKLDLMDLLAFDSKQALLEAIIICPCRRSFLLELNHFLAVCGIK